MSKKQLPKFYTHLSVRTIAEIWMKMKFDSHSLLVSNIPKLLHRIKDTYKYTNISAPVCPTGIVLSVFKGRPPHLTIVGVCPLTEVTLRFGRQLIFLVETLSYVSPNITRYMLIRLLLNDTWGRRVQGGWDQLYPFTIEPLLPLQHECI